MHSLLRFYFIASLLSIISCLSIGFFVYLRKQTAKNLVFLLFNVNLSAWAFCIIIITRSWHDIETVTFWIRMATAVAVFIPAVFYHFVLQVGQETQQRTRSVLACYFCSLVLGVISFTPSFISQAHYLTSDTALSLGIPQVVYGPSFVLVVIYSLIALGSAISYLWRKRNKSSGMRRIEYEYVLLSIGLAFALTVVTVFLFPYLDKGYLSPIAIFSGVLISAIIAYGIARHRILEVSLVIQKTTVYMLLTVCLGLIYAAAVFLFALIFRQFYASSELYANMLAALAIAFAFGPLKGAIQNAINTVFRKNYQPEKILGELSDILASRQTTAQIQTAFLHRITGFLNAEESLMILMDKRFERYNLVAGQGERLNRNAVFNLQSDAPLIQELLRGNILVCEEMDRLPSLASRDTIISSLRKIGAEIAVPLLLKNELLGALFFGYRNSGPLLTAQNIKVIQVAATQFSIFIKNVELFSQLERAERLVAVGTLAAGMAHEIRNPLVSIKTFVQLVPERFNDPDFRNKFSRIAAQEVDRINRLIEELLNFARPVPLQKRNVEPQHILEHCLFMLENEMAERKIQLRKELREEELFIEGDEIRLQQVFSNLLLNSIQAMEKGGTLTVTTGYAPDKPYALIKITDTGKGISPENLSRIFDPFFSTKTKGTGLGLAIVHSTIKEHGGHIDVCSIPDQETTFTIEFPLADMSKKESP